MFEFVEVESDAPIGARIKVIGVGGGGGNAVNNMVEASLDHVEYVVANTDQQALTRSLAATCIQMGTAVTRGLGAGARPEVGHRAAIEDEAAIREAVEDADMVFVTAGMGGGTGTGAAPVIARIARECGALTVAVVTRPFTFEGRSRSRRAEAGLRELAEAVDTLIVIPNDRLLELAGDDTSLTDGFKLADSVLLDAVRGISDIILTPGLINVDFADVVTIMQGRGMALMGTGLASGPDRAREAASQAISSPLLEDVHIEGATGLLVNITGGPKTSLRDVNAALSLIQDAVHEDTDTIFGAVVDPSMGDEIRITVVATGFDRAARVREDERQAWQQRLSTGEQQQAAPIESVQVPVYAGVREAEAAAESAAAAEPPSLRPAAYHTPAAQIPPPPNVERRPSHAAHLDSPTFQRVSPEFKREPVMRNPFSPDATSSEFDKPAFMRK
ncbi:MAG: cell division protein FtsZ [Myxococcales bacterium]|nr:cell division protein FtsZ [Myxococcales bacterium]